VLEQLEPFLIEIRDQFEWPGTRILGTIPAAVYYFRTDEDAKKIVRLAIEQYKKRKPELIRIPKFKKQVIGGFSFESMMELFSKINPESPISVLNEAILSGEIKGVCAFAGCRFHSGSVGPAARRSRTFSVARAIEYSGIISQTSRTGTGGGAPD